MKLGLAFDVVKSKRSCIFKKNSFQMRHLQNYESRINAEKIISPMVSSTPAGDDSRDIHNDYLQQRSHHEAWSNDKCRPMRTRYVFIVLLIQHDQSINLCRLFWHHAYSRFFKLEKGWLNIPCALDLLLRAKWNHASTHNKCMNTTCHSTPDVYTE